MTDKENKALNSKIKPISTAACTVLLVEARSSSPTSFETTLKDAGYQVIEKLKDTKNLIEKAHQFSPEVLIISVESPDEKLLDSLSTLYHDAPLPIIMFANQDAPKMIQQTIKVGVNAYIVHDIQPLRIPSIITTAIARFNEYQSLKNELEKTKTQLAERKVIEKAKGLLMERKHLTEKEAYHQLRKLAMDNGLTLISASENIISVLELFDTKSST